jgi:hypothetical protein
MNLQSRSYMFHRPFLKIQVGLLVWGVLAGSAQASSRDGEERYSTSRTNSPMNEEFPESRFGAPPAVALLDDPYQRMLKELNQEDFKKKPARSLSSVDSLGDADATTDIRDGILPPSILKSGTQEVSVIAHELGFFPKSIFVTQNVPVRMFITSASKRALCIMIDEFQVRRQVRSQEVEEFTFTPTTPGQYRFYCPMNGMEGMLWVRELRGSFNPQRIQSLPVREEY